MITGGISFTAQTIVALRSRDLWNRFSDQTLRYSDVYDLHASFPFFGSRVFDFCRLNLFPVFGQDSISGDVIVR